MWRWTVHTDGGVRTAADQMCAVARYYDISSKADCGDIFIIHDQKSPLCSSNISYFLSVENGCAAYYFVETDAIFLWWIESFNKNVETKYL